MNHGLFLIALVCLGQDAPQGNLLKSMPQVATVEAKRIDNPTSYLIHILDWHLVDKASFIADMEDQGITEGLAERYAKHLDEVEAVQSQQKELLQALKLNHQVTEVYIEGLAKDDKAAFGKRAKQLYSLGRIVALNRQALRTSGRNIEDFKTKLGTVEASHRIELLRIGAAGQLQAERVLKVLPAEDKAAHEAARPVREDGTVRFDPMLNDAREDTIVKNALAGESTVSVLILGGAHDLSDNVPEGVQYIRVGTKAYRGMAGRQ